MARTLPGLTGVDHIGFTVPDLTQARTFLGKNRDAFLFRSGAAEEVDTSQQGNINW